MVEGVGVLGFTEVAFEKAEFDEHEDGFFHAEDSFEFYVEHLSECVQLEFLFLKCGGALLVFV